jgi:hypothetical protein
VLRIEATIFLKKGLIQYKSIVEEYNKKNVVKKELKLWQKSIYLFSKIIEVNNSIYAINKNDQKNVSD